jgi:anti-sigma-K factor RskA
MTACGHRDDAGAWVLGALDDHDARAFADHLRGCPDCRHDVAELQAVADALPLAAPQVVPPPALKGRIMTAVESEARLLHAAGPEADVPARAPRRRRRAWPRLRPLPALAAVCALLAVGVSAGLLLSSGGDGATTYRAQAPRGADVVLRVEDGHGRLDVRGMPAPPRGRVYQVWLAHGTEAPRPTDTLWVPRDGRATVQIDAGLGDADQVMVTAEPSGGSDRPTSAPVVRASLS